MVQLHCEGCLCTVMGHAFLSRMPHTSGGTLPKKKRPLNCLPKRVDLIFSCEIQAIMNVSSSLVSGWEYVKEGAVHAEG